MLLKKRGNTLVSCNPHPWPCASGPPMLHWYHLLSAQRPYQLPCLLHLYTRLLPNPAALAFWKMEKEDKEAGFRDGCRRRDGKGDRERDRGEASCCLRSSRIKSQTVQDIDKSFHVDVLSISFQLIHNRFSSGKNRNIVL